MGGNVLSARPVRRRLRASNGVDARKGGNRATRSPPRLKRGACVPHASHPSHSAPSMCEIAVPLSSRARLTVASREPVTATAPSCQHACWASRCAGELGVFLMLSQRADDERRRRSRGRTSSDRFAEHTSKSLQVAEEPRPRCVTRTAQGRASSRQPAGLR